MPSRMREVCTTSQRVPADVRDLQRLREEARSIPGSKAETAARRAPRRCPRTGTAGRGRCRAAERRVRRRRGSRRATRASSALRRAEVADAGNDRCRRRRRGRPDADGVKNVGADRGRAPCARRSGCRRRSRSSAIYSRPFGGGQHPRRAAGPSSSHAQGARERLEDRLDLVVARAAVEHLDVHVGARALREALRRSPGRAPTADLRRVAPSARDRRPRAAGRRDRPRRRRASRPSASRSSRRD